MPVGELVRFTMDHQLIENNAGPGVLIWIF